MPVLLTPRQRRELDYHRKRAERLTELRTRSPSLTILSSPQRRWWNAYWHTYSLLLQIDMCGKTALVVGCGFGDDTVRLNALGANVVAFDLSPESVSIAEARTAPPARVSYSVMAAEAMDYADDLFDVILAVDILHHVDIPATMRQLQRVAKDGCHVVCNEVYTHSWLTRLRESWLVRNLLYPRVRGWIYGTEDPYITEDERKLSERDIGMLRSWLGRSREDYFDVIVGRLVPDRFHWISRADRLLLQALGPLASVLGGRVVISGTMRKR